MTRKITSFMGKIKIATFVMLLFTTFVNAQLSDFSLTVTKTDETCLGNGSLTFSVSNTTPNAAMLYKVYKLPNANTPVAVLSTGYLGSLGAATYKVVAMQSMGSLLNSKEKTVTIGSQIVPLVFSLTSSNQNCATGGSVVINTTSGTFASAEIIGGPQTRPMQSSNVFDGLPGGTYKIRVFNACGIGKVKTYTLALINAVLNIGDTAYPDATSPLCDQITISNTITPSSGTISYPLTVSRTLSVLDISGNNMVFNDYFATGDPNSLTVTATIPRLQTDSYTYDINVTDGCNTVYEKSAIIDPSIKVGLAPIDAPCANKYLKLTASRFTGSYTVNITGPAGFNPVSFNPTPQGPFTLGTVIYGSATNPVPFGTYEVTITDSCNRTATTTLEVEFEKPQPSVSGVNNGCFSLFGKITASVPGANIVSARVVDGPASYSTSYDVNVDSSITANGELVILDVPIGTYKIEFTDDCGFTYPKTVTVPPFVQKDFYLVTLPGCEPGYGTVRYQSGNGDLTSVQITAAPYSGSFPIDVSQNIIANGDFYMGNLPEGQYSFKATDVCGIVHDLPIFVEGYHPPQTGFEFTPNCGSFSVKVTDAGNGTEGVVYFLQKYYPNTGTWGHPGNNNNPYTEGAVPTAQTGLKLVNLTARNNLNYQGKFRIIKKFESFTTATSDNSMCVSSLGEFNYNDGLSINTAYTLACVGSPNDVMLEITGQPTSFKIIEKNGQPFSFDNGASNIFVNIEPAEYVFQIENDCGDIVTQWFNVLTLPSIADATQPEDMVLCVENGTAATYQYHLTDQNNGILNGLYSAMYTITYHLTFEDADTGVNPLPEYYTSTGNGQIVYARLIHNEISLCHGVTSFKLFVGEYQEPIIATTGTICNDSRLGLSANAGYSSYLWSTGETTQSIFVTEPGVYTVIVEKDYGTTTCDGYAEVEIKESYTPEIIKIESEDWTEDNNTITVHAQGAADLEYSLDGVTYQTSNVFTGLDTGLFNIYVKDAHGCGQVNKEVVLLNYPNYFTPNGDGSHDTWNIKHAPMEPHMKVVIMDRYGKIITAFGSTSRGWDGTLNGIQLPSTDYWFVVTREDGRELKGHFAMLR